MQYEGNHTKGIDFFNLLYKSEKFCLELGKFNLVAGKLEAELILYYQRNNLKENLNKATLGKLISIGEKNNLLDRNLLMTLKQFSIQRNELTHNIYSLFIDLKEDSILEKDNLLDSDVHTYIEFVWIVKNNFNDISEIIKKL